MGKLEGSNDWALMVQRRKPSEMESDDDQRSRHRVRFGICRSSASTGRYAAGAHCRGWTPEHGKCPTNSRLTAELNIENDSLPDAPGVATQQDPQVKPGSSPTPGAPSPAPAGDGNQQTKRILYIFPNFRAVSSDQKLPPQTVKEKFKTAALDSVDYSSFIFVGIQAGIAQASNSYPEFRQGAAGYGRYYWHTLQTRLTKTCGLNLFFRQPCVRIPVITQRAMAVFPSGLPILSPA